MPRTYPVISFGRKLRVAPPPYDLAQRFLRARPPVGADAQVALASRPQRENPLALVSADDLDTPSTHKLLQAHAQGGQRRKPVPQIPGQRSTLLLQVEE